MSSVSAAFDAICNTFMNKQTAIAVNVGVDQIQAFYGDHIVLLGLHSLRCSVITKTNNTAITISPVLIDMPKFKQEVGTTLSIFSNEETVRNTFNSLVVDDGELFQLSTVYNCNFDSIQEILPKYIEVLETAKERVRKIAVNDAMIDEALTNLKSALLQYEA